MLGDSHWFMYDPDEQAITSGTTRTVGVRTGRCTDIMSAFNMSKAGCNMADVQTDFKGHPPIVIVIFIVRSVYRL